jgi:hypothetical protein
MLSFAIPAAKVKQGLAAGEPQKQFGCVSFRFSPSESFLILANLW